MLSRIVLFSGAAILAAVAVLAAGCGGGSRRAGKGNEIVAAFYPLAFAAEQIAGASAEVRNLTPAGAEPHDLELTPSDVRAVARRLARPLPRRRLHAGPRDGGEATSGPLARRARRAAPAEGLRREARRATPTSGSIPVRYAEMVRLIGAALGKKAPAARLARRLDALDARVPPRPRPLRPPPDRDEPRRVRLSRGPLRARAGSARGAHAGGRAVGAGHRPARRRRPQLRRHDGVLRDAHLAEARRDGRPRSATCETAVLDPLEGIGKSEIAAGADYFSVMRANLATLRKALGCTS